MVIRTFWAERRHQRRMHICHICYITKRCLYCWNFALTHILTERTCNRNNRKDIFANVAWPKVVKHTTVHGIGLSQPINARSSQQLPKIETFSVKSFQVAKNLGPGSHAAVHVPQKGQNLRYPLLGSTTRAGADCHQQTFPYRKRVSLKKLQIIYVISLTLLLWSYFVLADNLHLALVIKYIYMIRLKCRYAHVVVRVSVCNTTLSSKCAVGTHVNKFIQCEYSDK